MLGGERLDAVLILLHAEQHANALLNGIQPIVALVVLVLAAAGAAFAWQARRMMSASTHLSVLQEAAEQMSRHREKPEIIQSALSFASAAVGAELAALTLGRPDENSTNLYCLVDGEMRVERVGLATHVDHKRAGVQTGEGRDKQRTGNYQPRCTLPAHYPALKGVLGTRIQTSYGEIGEIFVANKGNPFTSRDEAAIALLANQVTQHLEYQELLRHVKRGYMETIEALVNAIEAKDPYTRGHSERVIRYAVATAEEMGLPPEQVEEIRIGAVLHDIGKIGVPESVINKPGRLDDDEWQLMKDHPRTATKIIDSFNRSRDILLMIYHHHEMYDGSGYPTGLRGNDIPLAARILKVADAFEAMTSHRPYQKTKTLEQAVQELKEGSGTQFDPLVVSAFIRALQNRCEEESQ